MTATQYDPFEPGTFRVETRSLVLDDEERDRRFPCEIWAPAGSHPPVPLVLFSHSSGQDRRAATYLTTHLASHGYVVAAIDHSEKVDASLGPQTDESSEQRITRIEGMIESRVPDLRFLLDRILEEGGSPAIDSNRIGLVGHSFGGWSVLATPERESRIGAIVALAPAGATDPRPGILPVELTFAWSREVPVLYIVAENDTPLPLQGMHELFDRTRGRRLMIILGGADHSHFEDDVERRHEEVRGMSFPEYLSWLPAEMLPISSLITGDQAHLAIRGLALAHFDATLKREERADELLSGDIVTSLASHGLKVAVRRD